MKNIQLLILALGLLFVSSAAAHQITGVVTSAETGNAIQGVQVHVKENAMKHAVTDRAGKYSIDAQSSATLVFSLAGKKTHEETVGRRTVIHVALVSTIPLEKEETEVSYDLESAGNAMRLTERKRTAKHHTMSDVARPYAAIAPGEAFNREGYSTIHENGFKSALAAPLSTFSIDVDAASYSNMRRFLNNGTKPPIDAVRIEEMINYFDYDYPNPRKEHPFAVYNEVSVAPWNSENLLLHIGIQGEKLDFDKLPPSNIVFLLDVSGSMNNSNKLPLLKKSLQLLVNQLDEDDRIAIVVYAGNSGLVLPSTSGNQKEKILAALNQLQAGGSTAGGAGLELAYKVASENFIRQGNNRIILATDGDFNVGISSNAEMERLIEKKREKGIFISVLGFGMGNYQDSKMEIIADKGNGNYAYIDNILEAKKVLVNEFGGTLFTIAKDVKIQIEFNPAVVESYRLIGYENRLLNNEDFADDKKDAGELGSGHTVTALYEIIPAKKDSQTSGVLKYQNTEIKLTAFSAKEMATVKFRYKKPDGDKSILMEQIIFNSSTDLNRTSNNYRFSAAVAGFGMLLRDSEFKGNLTWQSVIEMAQNAKGADENGYRSEMIQLIKLANHL
ncbi:MAG: von Willebrand factor type A domain-containing protein [Salinivirgaceae bacterium]|jgi:Ca-activated chloride channel family protein|nr:von Willebrand factor type A domain-containing protein [Salinivirgaceae bacterium]